MNKQRLFSCSYLLFSLLMFFSAILLSAQETPATEEDIEKPILCFDLVNYTENNDNSDLGDLFADSVIIGLESMNFLTVKEPEIEQLLESNGMTETDTQDYSKMMQLAQQAGAGAVITGLYRVEANQVYMAVKAYDVATGRIASGLNDAGPAGLSLYDTIDEMVQQMVSAINREFAPLKAAIVEQETEEIVVEEKIVEELVELGGETKEIALLSPDEGAALEFGEYYDDGTIVEGKYELRVKTGTVLKIRISHEGYSTRVERVRIKEGVNEYKLPALRPRASSGKIEVFLTTQKPFGIGGGYTLPLIADWLEIPVRTGLYAFPEYYDWENDIFGGGLWAVNLPLEAGLSGHFLKTPGGTWQLAGGGGLFMDNFFFPAPLFDPESQAEGWVGFIGLYAELQQEIHIGPRLILYLNEQYKTRGLLGPPQIVGINNGFGQFLFRMGVQWVR